MNQRPSRLRRLRTILIGAARNPTDSQLFHRLALVALLAWVGLGADALSSSAYGPEQAYLALREHVFLTVFVAAASAVTVLVISASYTQIIELFPSGGGGYVVASKLLSPTLGMVAGSALIIDYVLTISVSIASGADAVFSFLPAEWLPLKIPVAVAVLALLTIANLRGVRESVMVLVPFFAAFLVTHIFAIGYAIVTNLGRLPEMQTAGLADLGAARADLGLLGVLFIVLRAYSLGAGTFTGIEAVSEAMPILREPRVQTAKRTMIYVAGSLAITVVGIMVAYLIYEVQPETGKTLNAVLFGSITAAWPSAWSTGFVLVTLVSEAALLFVAAQAGFAAAPRVLSFMARDGWVPTRFATLSDRLVTGNGILLISGAALLTLLASDGSVSFLVVLYSINVFITFFLAQLGLVRHWSGNPRRVRRRALKLAVSGAGAVLTGGILISVIVLKFGEGGWITLFVTAALAAVAWAIRRRYSQTRRLVRELDDERLSLSAIVPEAPPSVRGAGRSPAGEDPDAPTAVLLVRRFDGLGMRTLLAVLKQFPGFYRNFVFIQVGAIDAHVFQGAAEVEQLRRQVRADVNRYVQLMQWRGYSAEARWALGTDVVQEISGLANEIVQRFPRAVFFAGEAIYTGTSMWDRWLHHHTADAVEERLTAQGMTFVTVPVRLEPSV